MGGEEIGGERRRGEREGRWGAVGKSGEERRGEDGGGRQREEREKERGQ